MTELGSEFITYDHCVGVLNATPLTMAIRGRGDVVWILLLSVETKPDKEIGPETPCIEKYWGIIPAGSGANTSPLEVTVGRVGCVISA